MKLSLKDHKGVAILTADGAINEHTFKVLKAGINKLFQSGKNRLILELNSTVDLDDTVLRELSILNIFARELLGEIALVIADERAKERAENFAKPNVLHCFTDKVVAYNSFFEKKEGHLSGVPKALQEQSDEIRALKEKIQSLESGEVSSLKSENLKIKNENKELFNQMTQMLIERRKSTNEQAHDQKISILEAELEKLTTKLAELDSSGTPPAAKS